MMKSIKIKSTRLKLIKVVSFEEMWKARRSKTCTVFLDSVAKYKINKNIKAWCPASWYDSLFRSLKVS